MREIKIARRYAQAFFISSLKAKTIAKDIEEINLVVEYLKVHKKLFTILYHPFSRYELKEGILTQATANVSTEVKNFLFILLQKNRIKILPEIYNQLIFFQDKYLEIEKGEVLSVVHLTDEEQNKVIDKLQKLLNKKVILNFNLDKNLLGGLLIKVGNKVIDGSIKGSLKKLKESLITHYS